MFVIGLVAGILFGFISSLLPGLNVGISFMLISISGVDPTFALGFLIGSDSVSGVLKQVSVLNPVGRSDEVYTNQAVVSFNKEQAKKAAFNAVMTYCLIKVIALGIGAVAFATGLAANLNFGVYYQPIGIGVFLLMWGKLIFASKSKISTFLIIVAGIFLGWMVSKNATNSMLVLSSAVISIPASIEMIKAGGKKTKDKSVDSVEKIEESDESLNLSSAIAGVISTVFMGLPTSALIQAFDNKEDNQEKIIQSACAEAASSGLGLVMVMASGSARSAIASNIALTMPAFNLMSALGILFLVMTMTFIMFAISRSLISLMSGRSFNSRFVGIFSLICTTALVIGLGGYVGVSLIVVGIVLNQTIKQTEAPSSSALSCISATPILAMLGV